MDGLLLRAPKLRPSFAVLGVAHIASQDRGEVAESRPHDTQRLHRPFERWHVASVDGRKLDKLKRSGTLEARRAMLFPPALLIVFDFLRAVGRGGKRGKTVVLASFSAVVAAASSASRRATSWRSALRFSSSAPSMRGRLQVLPDVVLLDVLSGDWARVAQQVNRLSGEGNQLRAPRSCLGQPLSRRDHVSLGLLHNGPRSRDGLLTPGQLGRVRRCCLRPARFEVVRRAKRVSASCRPNVSACC